MASSLGAAFGVAISAAIFTAISSGTASARWMEGVITFYGRQDNLAVRTAAMIALMFNALMVSVAILAIMLTIPGGRSRSRWNRLNNGEDATRNLLRHRNPTMHGHHAADQFVLAIVIYHPENASTPRWGENFGYV